MVNAANTKWPESGLREYICSKEKKEQRSTNISCFKMEHEACFHEPCLFLLHRPSLECSIMGGHITVDLLRNTSITFKKDWKVRGHAQKRK